MKAVFAGSLALLALLSFIAMAIQRGSVDNERTVLTWTVDENASRKEQAALFEKLYPQFRLKIDENNSDRAKVIVQSLADVGPDLFCCYWAPDLSAYVRSGIAWDITDELARMGIDPLKDCWNGGNPCLLYEGRVYGFSNNAGVDALWFNKDIFDRLGIPYPSGPMTWEEFIPLAQRLTLRDEKGRVAQYGFSYSWYFYSNFLKQWGGRIYTPDGARCVLDSPESIAAIQFMQDLIFKYGVSPTPAEEMSMATQGGWGSGAISLFGAGKYATALGGRWWLMSLRKVEDLRLGVCESPHGPRRVFMSYGKATLINKHSPRRQDALKFVEFLNSREHNNLVSHQGDALGPVIKYSYTDEYLHDPDFPQETYNDVWRDVMQYGEPEEASPFINGSVAMRIVKEQLDLVQENQKSAAEAMRSAARQINDEIRKQVAMDPTLRARYEALTGKPLQAKP